MVDRYREDARWTLILPHRGEPEAAKIETAMIRGEEALGLPHRGSDHNGQMTISADVVRGSRPPIRLRRR